MSEPNTWEQPPRMPAGIISCGGVLTKAQCDEIKRTWAESGSPAYVIPKGARYTLVGEHGPEPTLPDPGRNERR